MHNGECSTELPVVGVEFREARCLRTGAATVRTLLIA